MTKLKIFIIAQIVLGSLVGFFAMPYILFSIFAVPCVFFHFGLIASHVSLLGFWAGMGLSILWKRLVGLFAGVIGLWIVGSLVITDFSRIEILFLMFVTAGVVSLVSVFMRRSGIQLHKFSDEKHNHPDPKIQITIRGLLVATFCAALLSLLSSLNRNEIDTQRAMPVLFSLAFALVIIFATLLCMWAALSLVPPHLPTAIAVVVVLLMSLSPIWSVGTEYNWPHWAIVFEIFFLSHFGWTLATLLVVRSYGYRLTSKELDPNRTV